MDRLTPAADGTSGERNETIADDGPRRWLGIAASPSAPRNDVEDYRPWLRQRLTSRSRISDSPPVPRHRFENSGSLAAGRLAPSSPATYPRIGFATPSPPDNHCRLRTPRDER